LEIKKKTFPIKLPGVSISGINAKTIIARRCSNCNVKLKNDKTTRLQNIAIEL